ncbi:aminoacylase-1-like [Drosophila sulfurigaster albostrigata]|uniref:aminoacylase-1-like n=1 Tax=Drosophila sulfurigaster albostrigata TaxID=89887 RepID=UPI002D21CB07|nr:aminoacylase-1-like [Drosophila sulfurigaster albostrigata]
MSKAEWETNEEIEIFREYLKIPSVHPKPDYTPCVEFLKRQAESLDLSVQVVYPANEDNPVVVLKWEGSEPELPSIILNSHMDVVPVVAEKWKHEPFGAEMDDEGRIFARGTQDTKQVGTQYLGAIRALKAEGFQPKRTVYVTFVPDEELGGHLGMREFVKDDYFKSMNVGFSLDEGSPSLDETYYVFYAERTAWPFRYKFKGTAGHGSVLLPNTAGEKLCFILNKMMDYRASQVKRLTDDPELFIGDVTTVNLTQILGGQQNNVVPAQLELIFDLRIAVDVDLEALEQQARDWCEEAGGDVEIIFERKDNFVAPTKIGPENPFWVAFEQSLTELNLKFKPQVCPGGTDSRYLRQQGVSALGFSPMNNNTPILAHDHDEFIKADVYLHGIEVYKKIIPAVANA